MSKHTIEVNIEWDDVEAAGFVYSPYGWTSTKVLKETYGIEKPFVPKPSVIHWISRQEREAPLNERVLIKYNTGTVFSGKFDHKPELACTHWAPYPEEG